MRFTPMSNLIDPGIYDFEVISSEDAISQKGNEMIKLQLRVWDMNGRDHVIYDYLLEAMAYKLRHFCEISGLLSRYEAGELLANDCLGKTGKVEILIQPGNPNPTGGYFPDKNSVKDYVSKIDSKKVTRDEDPFFDDSVPF